MNYFEDYNSNNQDLNGSTTSEDKEMSTNGSDNDSNREINHPKHLSDTHEPKDEAAVVEWQSVLPSQRAKPPDPFTLTHINQSHDLLAVSTMVAVSADKQTSKDWLTTHGLQHLKLEIQDVVDKGYLSRPEANVKDGNVLQGMQFETHILNDFEHKLHKAIDTYTKRIKWLLEGSRRMFGHMIGQRIAVCIDLSNTSTGFGRLSVLQESLMHFIEEQLSTTKALYIASFGTEIKNLWPVVCDTSPHIVNELKQWVMAFKPSGGCNLLAVLKHLLKIKDIDSVFLIVGSIPDQHSDVITSYVEQISIGCRIPINTVSFDCNSHLTNMTLQKLATDSGGRYHCYTATSEEQLYTGTDIAILLQEIQRAQAVLNQIKEMKQGIMGSAIVNIVNEISLKVARLPQFQFLPRPPGHDSPLRLQTDSFQPKTSYDWLIKHGLKGKHLDLYQVLGPNSYPIKEDFVPIIKKAVYSQIYKEAMVRFDWHDGRMRHIHVDITQLFEYQKRLGAAVRLYERRIDWLSTASRRIFGTITENNIVILVDTSVSNVKYLVHIQHSLRLLLEQQISNVEYFNIIGFGSDLTCFRPTLVKPTIEILQEAWKWVLTLNCCGSRNFLASLRETVENDEQIKHQINVQGIYLFTSGVPDQPCDVVSSFLQETCVGKNIRLHSILFNVDDYNMNGAIPGRYANIMKTAQCLRTMAHCTAGRFHWFRETGIIESDDITALTNEIDKAVDFSYKCGELVTKIKTKYPSKQLQCSQSIKQNVQPINTDVRTNKRLTVSSRPASAGGDRKTLGWRPSSGPITKSTLYFKRPRPHSAQQTISTSFFLEQKSQTGDKIGSIYKKYSPKKCPKNMGEKQIPDQEDIVSSKEWLRRYRLSKLKLDLTKLVTGQECQHVKQTSKLSAQGPHTSDIKYCHMFPSVNVNGIIRHLQFLPHELTKYDAKLVAVLKRYLKRLQWLLSGSRHTFGVITEKRVVILIDTSGSMNNQLEVIKKQLISLVWDQLHANDISFNLISFSDDCMSWQDSIVSPSAINCEECNLWINKLVASGGTCTLSALKMAFDDQLVEAIYLISDGKPDTSTTKVLRESTELSKQRNVPVHTVNLQPSDSDATEFLRLLCKYTGGRYHCEHKQFDVDIFIHKLLHQGLADNAYPHLPSFEGDDLRRLGQEISIAQKYLSDSAKYRKLYSEQMKEECTRIKENLKKQCLVKEKNVEVGRVS